MKFTQRSTVDFPEPERPKITTTSPRCTSRSTPSHHLEVAEALVQPVDADDDVVGLIRRRLHAAALARCGLHGPGDVRPVVARGRSALSSRAWKNVKSTVSPQ